MEFATGLRLSVSEGKTIVVGGTKTLALVHGLAGVVSNIGVDTSLARRVVAVPAVVVVRRAPTAHRACINWIPCHVFRLGSGWGVGGV